MIDLFYGSWVQEDFLEGNTDFLKLLIPVRLKDSRFHKFGSNECRLLHKLHCMPVLQCWESLLDIIIWHNISKSRKCTLDARQKSLDKITFYIESEWRTAFHLRYLVHVSADIPSSSAKWGFIFFTKNLSNLSRNYVIITYFPGFPTISITRFDLITYLISDESEIKQNDRF